MSLLNPIHTTIRNVRRFNTIVTTLARFGFEGVLQDTGIDRLIDRGAALLGRSTGETQHLRPAERMRLVMEELGPTFIKMGQILSTRRDLIPDDWAEEFAKLQDSVPALPFADVRDQVRTELGPALDEHVAEIEKEPMAAASMAQVHRARLTDGREIVLKILRPGIEDVVEADLEVLRFLAGRVQDRFTNLGVNPLAVVDEFAREIRKELNFEHEARSTERLGNYFAEDDDVLFPEVIWEASTRRVLGLTEIHGTPLSKFTVDSAPLDERRKAVNAGANAVLRQCLEIGFFHADPHPGNLFFLPGGRVAFIDCGMTGSVDHETRSTLAQLVYGVTSGNVEAVMDSAIALCDVDRTTLDERLLRLDIQDIVEQFSGVPLERFDLGEVLDQLFAALRRHRVTMPADITLLIKALSSIEGAGRILDTDFDMIACARPYVERLIMEQSSPMAMVRRMRDATLAYTKFAEALPAELSDLLNRLRRNRLTLNLEHRGLADITEVIEHASRNIAYALVIAALVVGSSILILSERNTTLWVWTVVGTIGLGLAAAVGVVLLGANRRYTRKARKRKRQDHRP